MKIKTAEATGLALDYGLNHVLMLENGFVPEISGAQGRSSEMYSHTDPAVCMGLINEHKITLAYWNIAPVWSATPDDKGWDEHGDTPEQAVARCVISMKLGEQFEVPDELGVMS